VVQFIYDFNTAIGNCHKLLKPGGYLLLTVPGISNIGKDPWNWYWSFTSFSIKEILSQKFKIEDLNIESFGNVLISSAFYMV
jgi:SAM-dependent methyltransferase